MMNSSLCGYIEKESNVNSIVIAQYDNTSNLIYKGHVTLGISSEAIKIIKSQKKLDYNLFEAKENVIWIEPTLVCTIKYMYKNENGSLRQPVFRGLRLD